MEVFVNTNKPNDINDIDVNIFINGFINHSVNDRDDINDKNVSVNVSVNDFVNDFVDDINGPLLKFKFLSRNMNTNKPLENELKRPILSTRPKPPPNFDDINDINCSSFLPEMARPRLRPNSGQLFDLKTTKHNIVVDPMRSTFCSRKTSFVKSSAAAAALSKHGGGGAP